MHSDINLQEVKSRSEDEQHLSVRNVSVKIFKQITFVRLKTDKFP